MTQHPPFLRTIVCLSLAKSALLVVEAPPQHAFALDRNTATRNAQVTHMTWSIVGTHAKRRGAPPDMHCFACETRFGPDDKLHLAGIISRKNKCGCDDCHADAAPGTLFVAAYCRKAACRRPEIFQAWVDRVTSPHVRADEDRSRVCASAAGVRVDSLRARPQASPSRRRPARTSCASALAAAARTFAAPSAKARRGRRTG
jgi:hypothetical protein